MAIIKKCTKCKKWKLTTKFYKKSAAKDGLKPWCKVCANEAHILYSPEIKNANNRKHRQAHVEEERERSRQWRQNNPEKAKEQKRKYQKENPLKFLEYSNNHRALKNNNGGKITAQEWEALKAKYNFTCLCCGRQEPEIKLELDHVIPLKLGGENTIENAQPLCGSCNKKKGTKHIDFRNSVSRLVVLRFKPIDSAKVE